VSSFFGNPRGDALEATLGNVEQPMFGEPLHRSWGEKAATLPILPAILGHNKCAIVRELVSSVGSTSCWRA